MNIPSDDDPPSPENMVKSSTRSEWHAIQVQHRMVNSFPTIFKVILLKEFWGFQVDNFISVAPEYECLVDFTLVFGTFSHGLPQSENYPVPFSHRTILTRQQRPSGSVVTTFCLWKRRIQKKKKFSFWSEVRHVDIPHQASCVGVCIENFRCRKFLCFQHSTHPAN